jgi:hypothetical protein
MIRAGDTVGMSGFTGATDEGTGEPELRSTGEGSLTPWWVPRPPLAGGPGLRAAPQTPALNPGTVRLQ